MVVPLSLNYVRSVPLSDEYDRLCESLVSSVSHRSGSVRYVQLAVDSNFAYCK
jgi:hypothetical protein